MSDLLSVETQLAETLGLGKLTPLKGGRTNRVWLSGDKVIKLYSQSAATPLFGNSAELEWAALTALEGMEIAPDPIDLQDTQFGKILIYKHISGGFGIQTVAEAADLMGRLHALKPTTSLPLPVTGRVVADGLAMLPIGHALRLSPPPEPPAITSSIVHRDPVFTNFISSPSGVRLIDWQCPGLGDPVEDIAHFLSPAMNAIYRGQPLKKAEIEAFCAAYPNASKVQDYEAYGQAYHWRMACYCAWQVARGNADYGPALELETAFLADFPQYLNQG